MAGIGQILVSESERDLHGVRRQRQRVISLLVDSGGGRHGEDRPVVRAGDGDCHGPDGAAAVIVEHPDVVGENQRLVLGQEIEIFVDVAERPFQLARAVAVALNLRTHRGLEMSER